MPPHRLQELPINNLQWEKFVHLIGKANAEVARFDGLLQSIPNPNILLSPLTTNEAVLSSKIEGTQATLQEVFEFEANPKAATKEQDIQEILNYRKALAYAVAEIANISLSNRLVKGIHTLLLDSVRGQNKDRGNFRKIQVFIGKSKNIEEAAYIPPSSNEVPELMSNLEKYIHSDEKDILVQLAIIHAQFEMIHPFLDGNGRVGRIMLPLFLYLKESISYPAFYLSSYFEENREEYYHRLLGISTNMDWEGWIEYFLNSVFEQAKKNNAKAKEIHHLYNSGKDLIINATHSKYAIKILDFIFVNPIFTSSQFVSYTSINGKSASRLIADLRSSGIIEIFSKGSGSRPDIYSFQSLLEIVK